MKDWKIVRLGDVLEQDKSCAVTIIPDSTYEMVGVYSFGRGLFQKEKLLGMNTSYKFFYQLKRNHIVMSQLFGWEGALALSSEKFENKYVSSMFPTFLTNEEVALREYIGHFLQKREIWQQLFERGSGMGSRRRTLNPESLLGIKIPLPPLAEQQRIANYLDNLKSKIDEVKRLREEQDKLRKNLLFSQFSNIIKEAEWLPMREVAPIHRRQVEVDAETVYNELGVRSFGRGLFEKPSFKGKDLSWQKPYWLKEGDLLLSNIKAWEGAVSIIPEKYNDWVGSHRYITCLPNKDKINPDFLFYYFTIQEGVEKLDMASSGSADRNKTLSPKKLHEILIPVPLLDIQKKFVNLITKLNEAKAHQIAQLEELERLFPAMLDKAFKGEL